MLVLEAVNFIFQGLLCLFGQYALTVKLVLKPPLLLLLVFPHFQDFPLRLSFSVKALVESFASPLLGGSLFLEFVLHLFPRLATHVLLPVGRLPQLIPQSANFCFGDFRRFLCFT